MNIHDKARQMVQQSPHPMGLAEAYRRLARRGARKRAKAAPVDMTKVRLPYKDAPEIGFLSDAQVVNSLW